MGTKNNTMNNVMSSFSQILKFAKSYGIPVNNKRAILREYLQTKILNFIYNQNVSHNIIFIGGTSLRLLHDLPRFSEDLDFDLFQITPSSIKILMKSLVKKLTNENIDVNLYHNTTTKRYYYELRFPNLLSQLQLSNFKEEKLTIKFDYESYWTNHSKNTILLKRYGYLVNVVSIPLNQTLVQKLYAYTKRKQTLARDIFDIVWLYGQDATPDWNFAKKNKISEKIIQSAINKYKKEEISLLTFQKRLTPYLFDEKDKNKMYLFTKLISK